MKDNPKLDGFFSRLGQFLSFLDQRNVSLMGLVLMTGGIIGTVSLFNYEDYRERPPMIGSGLAVAGCLVSGALLQSSKQRK